MCGLELGLDWPRLELSQVQSSAVQPRSAIQRRGIENNEKGGMDEKTQVNKGKTKADQEGYLGRGCKSVSNL